MSRSPLSRRSFLRGAGGALVPLPPLAAMLAPNRSVAQLSEIPTRAIYMYSCNGTILPRWKPQGTETDFVLSEILAPLEPHQPKINVISGVSMLTAIENSGGNNGHDIGTGHSMVARPLIAGPSGFGEFGHLWDGTAGGTSIDQYIADRIAQETRFQSLAFGVGSKRIQQPIPSRPTWRENGDNVEPVEPMEDPEAAFTRLFGDYQRDDAALARLQIKRQLVVDAVLEDYKNKRAILGPEDRIKLDSHIDALSDLERRVAGLANALQCEPPTGVTGGDFRQTGVAQMDLLAASIGCDLTRVATLQWETGQGSNRFSWLGTDRAHHSISHDGDSITESQDLLTNINKFYAEQFSSLLTRLDAMTELDGQTVLDHSAVLWLNECDKGNAHTYRDMPYVLAGSGGGQWETGRYLTFMDKGHGDLYVSMMHAMGIDENSFGDPDFSSGPLPGL